MRARTLGRLDGKGSDGERVEAVGAVVCSAPFLPKNFRI